MPSDIAEDMDLENPLWAYSLRVYGRDSVKNACLALQDQLGADVNILLFMCWQAHRNMALPDGPGLDRIIHATADLREQVVEPLRRIRRTLPNAAGNLNHRQARKAVLAAELEGERLIQTLLFEKFGAAINGGADLRQAMLAYLERLPGNTDRAAAGLVDRLVGAVQAS